MGRYLFIGQETLDTWMEEGKIDFDSNVMTIKSDGRSFKLMEAVRFLKVEGQEVDKVGLLGTVKTNQQLESACAERYRDSVICQDTAYKVQEGFIAEILVDEPSPIATTSRAQGLKQLPEEKPIPLTKPKISTSKPSDQEEIKPSVSMKESTKKAGPSGDLSDEELLIRFLLNNTPDK